MKKGSIFLASLLVLATQSYAQTIAGYSFEKYPAPIYTGKKAKLNYASNSTAKIFKTRVTDAYNYKGGEVGFGGSYVVSIWGCGAGCISGAMIDKKTGNVYDLPIGENAPYDLGCYAVGDDKSGDERLAFEPNSRLFIARNCEQEQIGTSNKAKQTLTYFINVWDEKKKKFVEVKEVKQTRTVQTE